VALRWRKESTELHFPAREVIAKNFRHTKEVEPAYETRQHHAGEEEARLARRRVSRKG
jgi:hypothetical protein